MFENIQALNNNEIKKERKKTTHTHTHTKTKKLDKQAGKQPSGLTGWLT